MTEKDYPLYVLIVDNSFHPLGIFKGFIPPNDGRTTAIAFMDKEVARLNHNSSQNSLVDFRQSLFHKMELTTENYKGFALQTDAKYSDLLTLEYFIGFAK